MSSRISGEALTSANRRSRYRPRKARGTPVSVAIRSPCRWVPRPDRSHRDPSRRIETGFAAWYRGWPHRSFRATRQAIRPNHTVYRAARAALARTSRSVTRCGFRCRRGSREVGAVRRPVGLQHLFGDSRGVPPRPGPAPACPAGEGGRGGGEQLRRLRDRQHVGILHPSGRASGFAGWPRPRMDCRPTPRIDDRITVRTETRRERFAPAERVRWKTTSGGATLIRWWRVPAARPRDGDEEKVSRNGETRRGFMRARMPTVAGIADVPGRIAVADAHAALRSGCVAYVVECAADGLERWNVPARGRHRLGLKAGRGRLERSSRSFSGTAREPLQRRATRQRLGQIGRIFLQDRAQRLIDEVRLKARLPVSIS